MIKNATILDTSFWKYLPKIFENIKPDPKNIMQTTLSGSSESEIWTPLDPHPEYIMQIMLSGISELEFWTLRADPSPYSSQAIDQFA